jgi:hypothetical protein
MGETMRLAFSGLIGTTLGLAMAAGAAAQSNSCYLAHNGLCEEGIRYFPHLCEVGTDAADCRDSEFWPGSDEYMIEAWDLVGRDPAWLRLVRNEIFARHGYAFSSQDLALIFDSRDWYRAEDQSVALGAIERANVDLIQSFEADPMGPLALPPVSGVWTARLVDNKGPSASVVIGPSGTLVQYDPGTEDFYPNLLIPHDHELAYSWAPDQVPGTAYDVGIEPVPLTPRLLAIYRVELTPLASANFGPYPSTTYDALGTDPQFGEVFDGTITVTQDGVVVAGDYRLLFWGCCGAEPEYRDYSYRLERLTPAPNGADPEPPMIPFSPAG